MRCNNQIPASLSQAGSVLLEQSQTCYHLDFTSYHSLFLFLVFFLFSPHSCLGLLGYRVSHFIGTD